MKVIERGTLAWSIHATCPNCNSTLELYEEDIKKTSIRDSVMSYPGFECCICHYTNVLAIKRIPYAILSRVGILDDD